VPWDQNWYHGGGQSRFSAAFHMSMEDLRSFVKWRLQSNLCRSGITDRLIDVEREAYYLAPMASDHVRYSCKPQYMRGCDYIR
jgi:hypothetical protein